MRRVLFLTKSCPKGRKFEMEFSRGLLRAVNAARTQVVRYVGSERIFRSTVTHRRFTVALEFNHFHLMQSSSPCLDNKKKKDVICASDNRALFVSTYATPTFDILIGVAFGIGGFSIISRMLIVHLRYSVPLLRNALSPCLLHEIALIFVVHGNSHCVALRASLPKNSKICAFRF